MVDFKVTLPNAYPTERLASASEQLAAEYPIKEEQRTFEAQVQLAAKGVPKTARVSTTSVDLRGYFFRSEDRLRVAQFRRDGFTYNRLAPYTTWSDIRNEALRLWELYRNVAQPESLERLALRYINKFLIPPRGNLRTYLSVLPPEIPGAPPRLATFLMRLASHDPDTHYLANVTLALEKDADPTQSVVILGIDVYTTTGLGLSSTDLAPILERLHAMKNEIFFGCITEETARMHER